MSHDPTPNRDVDPRLGAHADHDERVNRDYDRRDADRDRDRRDYDRRDYDRRTYDSSLDRDVIVERYDAKSSNPLIKLLTLDFLGSRTMRDIGLFILRAAMVLIFMHGLHKAQGYDGFVGAMGNFPIGEAAPGLFGFLVVAGQLLLGFGLLFGLLTRWSAFFLALMFIFIVTVVNIPSNGLVNPETGGFTFESSLFYLVPALALFFTGPGRFSIDHLLSRKTERRTVRER